MLCNLSTFNLEGKVIAVALSGGSDSVALLHFLKNNASFFNFTLKAINVEHGIRGMQSKSDSLFVKDLCESLSIPLALYEVDSLSFANQNKLSIEESARTLRYNCFFDAINKGFCNLIATAHHLKDNAETVLFNLFRGSGLKGITGINDLQNKIIRPFIQVPKQDIDSYIKENNLAFVSDQTNFDQKYSRNYIRHQILPIIEKNFPDAEKSILRFSMIARDENDFLEKETLKIIKFSSNKVEISINNHKALIKRAIIVALKHLGIVKDWEKIHVDDVFSLTTKESGKRISLPKNLTALREYDSIILIKEEPSTFLDKPYCLGEFMVQNQTYSITEVDFPPSLNDGLYIDGDKIPKTAVIRLRKQGDYFTKFGGGTVSLSDFFTDKKILPSKRDFIPLLADDNKILAIFGVAISSSLKIDENTKKIIKLT